MHSLPVVVFFEDEARFGRISREMACWVKSNMVPSVARQMVREYIYAYSALWREIRRKYFHNIIFENLDEVENTLQKALANYHHQKEETQKLSTGFLYY